MEIIQKCEYLKLRHYPEVFAIELGASAILSEIAEEINIAIGCGKRLPPHFKSYQGSEVTAFWFSNHWNNPKTDRHEVIGEQVKDGDECWLDGRAILENGEQVLVGTMFYSWKDADQAGLPDRYPDEEIRGRGKIKVRGGRYSMILGDLVRGLPQTHKDILDEYAFWFTYMKSTPAVIIPHNSPKVTVPIQLTYKRKNN